MLSQEERARYSRQIILPEIGETGQEKISRAKVLVIGAGGLGCPALQYLTAAGVGLVGIADGDVVNISNLQRQVLYTAEDTGSLKTTVAEKKLALLNPFVTFQTHPFFVDSGNILHIIRDYDIVVDGSDNFDTRYLVNDACVLLGKPMVSGAIYKFEGQVSVFNYNGGPTYRCIFPDPPGPGDSPNCAEIGVVAPLPGIIGTIQAGEVIKIITGIGEVLSGRLLVMDTLSMDTHIFRFKLNPANRNITRLQGGPLSCNIPATDITYTHLRQMMLDDAALRLIDVREAEEHASGNIGGINIPLSVLADSLHLLSREETIILYCASGVRSAKSAALLLSHGFKHVLSLKGGISNL